MQTAAFVQSGYPLTPPISLQEARVNDVVAEIQLAHRVVAR